MMYVVFYSTGNVFKAEEILLDAGIGCEVVPTPVQDKAYCGVCLKTQKKDVGDMLNGLEYKLIEVD